MSYWVNMSNIGQQMTSQQWKTWPFGWKMQFELCKIVCHFVSQTNMKAVLEMTRNFQLMFWDCYRRCEFRTGYSQVAILSLSSPNSVDTRQVGVCSSWNCYVRARHLYGAFLRTKYRTSIHQCFVKLIQILNNINQFRMGYIDFECHTSMLCNKQSLAVLNHSCVTAYN